MKVKEETKTTFIFSVEEIEDILIKHINGKEGMLVPEKYEVTHGRDSSITIEFERTREKTV